MVDEAVEQTDDAEHGITGGTGNVFADLGYPDMVTSGGPTAFGVRHRRHSQQRRRLNQAAAAETLGVGQPKVSALANYKLQGFSVDRLMTFSPLLIRMWRSSSAAALALPRALP